MSPENREAVLNLVYLVASVLFIFGMKGMTHPRTAVRGNLISGLAMLMAVVGTLVLKQIVGFWVIIAGLVVGSAVGMYLAIAVQMTAMPQMVAAFNGFGGAASILVAWAALIEAVATAAAAKSGVVDSHAALTSMGVKANLQMGIATAASGIIGAITFWGSMVAYAKLEEIKQFKKPINLPAHQLITAGLFVLCLLIGACIAWNPSSAASAWLYLPLALIASVLGVMLVIPIGGADMPVVIALLNSYSGLAAAATGFVINNNVLIIAGSLVGASGVILTQIMCKAMNRSLTHVLFGKLGPVAGGPTESEVYAGKVKSTTAEEIAMMLDGVRRVVIVPGYGMAVSQAQSAVRDLYNLLEQHGTNVEFAIHPVAGRMPGHMNVLLAEASIPYEKMMEMDAINPSMGEVDMAIVLGANDVVNPDGRNNPQSPIAGMPIIDVDKAHTVVVIKRSLSPGFAGIPNPLFAADKTLMFFADGKQAVMDIIAAIKQL